MPFNGSGTFNPLITFVPNTLATAEDQNTQDLDIAAGLTDCITRDGQSPATANLSIGGFQLNNVADPIVNSDAATKGWVLAQITSVTVSVRAAIAGGTDTATTDDCVIYWNYSYSGTKIQNVPGADNFKQGQQLVIKDLFGDAALHNIQIVALAGTIDLASTFTIDQPKESITLYADNITNNWIVA